MNRMLGSLNIIASGAQTLREAMKIYRWQLHLFQIILRPIEAGILSRAWKYTWIVESAKVANPAAIRRDLKVDLRSPAQPRGEAPTDPE